LNTGVVISAEASGFGMLAIVPFIWPLILGAAVAAAAWFVKEVVAGPWLTSGVFWTGAGALAATAGGATTAWVTYTVGLPRRRLLYGLRKVTPLVTAPDGVRAELELSHRGQSLDQPHVIEFELVGRGRRDISHGAFDAGAPIRFDLLTPIIELLEVAASDSSSSTPMPPVRIDGTVLTVGPSLIGRRQKLVFSLLVEGEPTLRCEAPLPDVEVREHDPNAVGRPPGWVMPAAVALGLLCGVFLDKLPWW
jgi:hypothetical protein